MLPLKYSTRSVSSIATSIGIEVSFLTANPFSVTLQVASESTQGFKEVEEDVQDWQLVPLVEIVEEVTETGCVRLEPVAVCLSSKLGAVRPNKSRDRLAIELVVSASL